VNHLNFRNVGKQPAQASAIVPARLFPACRQAGLLLSFAGAKERSEEGQAKERRIKRD
jgi:hypothetical protein